MGQITKRSYKLSDGRELIYFDDADTALPSAPGGGYPGARACRPGFRRLQKCGRRPLDRRVDLDRGGAAEPGVPAARRTRSPSPRRHQ